MSTDPPINPPTVGTPEPSVDTPPVVTSTPMAPTPATPTPVVSTSTGTSAPVDAPDAPGVPGALVMVAIVVAVLALAALLALGVLARRRRAAERGLDADRWSGPAPHPTPAQGRTDQGSAGPVWAPPAPDWAAVTAGITAFDLATSAAERYDAEQSLAQLGVTRLPVRRGDPVDPRTHNVVERRPDPNLAAGTVADVVRPGWVTATEMVRPADVSIVV